MSLEQIIEELKAKAIPKGGPDPTHTLTESDLPADMPLTNRLDKMTKEQARWALANGDAWIAYLEAQAAKNSQNHCRTFGESR